MDDFYTLQKKEIRDNIEYLATLRREVNTDINNDNKDFRVFNYYCATFFILATYMMYKHGTLVTSGALTNPLFFDGIVDGVIKILNKDDTSSIVRNVGHGNKVIKELQKKNREISIVLTVKSIESNKKKLEKMADDLRHYLHADERYNEGNSTAYCVVNYDYWNGIEELGDEESRDQINEFLYNQKNDTSHIIRTEKMIQYIEHYTDNEEYPITYIQLNGILFDIRKFSEDGKKVEEDWMLSKNAVLSSNYLMEQYLKEPQNKDILETRKLALQEEIKEIVGLVKNIKSN